MELLKRLMEERLGRRQRIDAVNGPSMLVSERSSSVTVVLVESHFTPYQLQGVLSLVFQEDKRESGSSSESLNCCRYKPSWFRDTTHSPKTNTHNTVQINGTCFPIVYLFGSAQ